MEFCFLMGGLRDRVPVLVLVLVLDSRFRPGRDQTLPLFSMFLRQNQ
jgi:hypothetical protein